MTAATPDPIQADPMLRVLRERHREVDIVVLPDPALRAAGPPPRPPAPMRADDVVRRADALLEELTDRLTRDRALPGRPARVHLWRADSPGRRFLESRMVVTDLADGENVRLLRACSEAFLELGWPARPVPGRRPRLVAARGLFRASATVSDGGFRLFLRSASLPVAQEVGR